MRTKADMRGCSTGPAALWAARREPFDPPAISALGHRATARATGRAAPAIAALKSAFIITLLARWRPLLAVLYHRISCTAQVRFCGPAALAVSPRDSQCHCMPDI